jgi:hypothetical protein
MNIAIHGAEVLQFHWNGKFLKNAIGHFKMPICCMILFLDADEFVSDEFVNEVAIKIQDPNYNGYTIQFQNYFMGKKLRYGYFNKWHFSKKSKRSYEKIEEDL